MSKKEMASSWIDGPPIFQNVERSIQSERSFKTLNYQTQVRIDPQNENNGQSDPHNGPKSMLQT